MSDITNSFVEGVMNKDLDERLIPEGTYRDALNIEIDTDEGSNVGSARNSLGNTLIGDINTLVTDVAIVNSKTIGAVKYEATNLIYWLVTSDNFDAIFEYNEVTGDSVRVLQSNTGQLGFNSQYIVTGINYINGFLYWTDDLNPPRRINIARCKSYAISDARIDDDLDVIFAPPLHSPTIRPQKDGSQANNMDLKYLSFSYRYKNIDGQYSAMSPFSATSFVPKELDLDFKVGFNKAMINDYNSVDITINTGDQFVSEIQVLMYDVRSAVVKVVETFNKKKLSLNNSVLNTFKFKNNKTYSVITNDQLTRTFDNVPLLAGAQDFIGNRLMYADYTQFRDIVDCDGKDISIDINLGFQSTDTPLNTPIQTFRSDRDYEVGIEYLDSYGRHTTVFTSIENTTYIPPTVSDKGNSLIVDIKSAPPCWATAYRLLVKQSKGSYYNIFPILYYPSGSYRYFLIAPGDRDKFAVGDYVIFKSDASGPTYSNKEYKVLDVQYREGTATGTGVSGLYFQIKVDSASEFDNTGVYSYSWESFGHGKVEKVGQDKIPADPFDAAAFKYVDAPIFYGVGDSSALSVVGSSVTEGGRISVEIESSSTFKYTVKYKNGTVTTNDVPIVVGTPIPLTIGAGSVMTLPIQFSTNSLVIGDRWVLNTRCNWNPNGSNPPYLEQPSTSAYYQFRTAAIVPGSNWSPTSAPAETDRAIENGAIISLQIKEDRSNPTAQAGVQTFAPSPRRFKNIEEWWYETEAYNSFIYYDQFGNNIGSQYGRVSFQRGKDFSNSKTGTNSAPSNTIDPGGVFTAESANYPVRMILWGCMPINKTEGGDLYNNPNDGQNKLVLEFKIRQQSSPNIAETLSKDNDLEVYHETSKTYAISNNMHMVTWHFNDFTTPQYAVDAGNYTNLGQLIPGAAITANDMEHHFAVGDTVYMKSTNQTFLPNGSYEVLYVPDQYNIVINLPWPGSGGPFSGEIGNDLIEQNQQNYIFNPAKIIINNTGSKNSDFNAWSFGNGLESYRIKDDFNAAELSYSPRVNAAVEEYKQKRSENAICYSGIYGANTSVNKLNEFNLSIANFKYLDKEFGSIQKLYGRDTDILVFQEDKISKVLYGKNILYDSAGGGQVASIPEVLGTQIAYPGEWGISRNPESFAEWGSEIFFTDAQRGAVLKMAGDQILPISSFGMTDYFRDLMKDNYNTQKLGCFDPYSRKYVLSSNDTSINKCKLSIYPSFIKASSRTQSIQLFTIVTDSSWYITLTDTGFGTSWLTGVHSSGYGTQDIEGILLANATGFVRTMIVTITYCNGLTTTFTVTQGRGRAIKLIPIVRNNKIDGPPSRP